VGAAQHSPPLALHWNKKLFREAGLDPDRPPQSLDELEEMSERLTIVEIKRGGKLVRVRYPDLTDQEKSAKDFKLVQVGHDPQQPGWWMPMWVYWFGGRLWDGQRHITANSPELTSRHSNGFAAIRRNTASITGAASARRSAISTRRRTRSSPTDRHDIARGVDVQFHRQIRAANGMGRGAVSRRRTRSSIPLVTMVDADVLVIPKGARSSERGVRVHPLRQHNRDPWKSCASANASSARWSRSATDSSRIHPNPYIKTFIELAKSPTRNYVPRLSVWGEYNDEMNVAIDRVTALSATPQQALISCRADAMETRPRHAALGRGQGRTPQGMGRV
jgi:multiple sugar transport system substrate-binding protein